MSSGKNRKGARGSALLVVVYVGALLGAAVGVYFYSASQNLARETVAHESSLKAQEVARLGVELAIANLPNVELGLNENDRVTVLSDWVARDPYGSTDEERTERRFTGSSMGFDYIVQVRAVREAKKIDNFMPEGWLTEVNPADYEYGKDLLEDFTAAYEIISAARTANRLGDMGTSTAANVTQAAEAAIRTVVSIDYRSLADDVKDFGVYFGNRAAKVGEGAAVAEVTGSSGGGTGTGGDGDDDDDTDTVSYAPTVFAWGEDHYAIRAVAKDTLDEQIIEDFISIPRDSQLFSVNNGYYSAAAQTMQFRVSDDPTVYNPNIPRTSRFGSAWYQYTMTSLRDDLPIDLYIFGGKQQTTNWERLQENGAYLRYYFGRSVHLLANGEIQERTESAGNPDGHAQTALAVGRIENFLRLYLNYSNPKTKTYASAPNSMPTAPHPTPASTEQLDKTSTNVANWKAQWHQVPLGYHSKARSYSANMPPQNRPLDNRLSGNRRRWNVLIWLKGQDGRFLAREYTDPYYMNQSKSVSAGYTPANNTWNGRYRWFYYKGYQDTTSTRYHMGTNSYATRNGYSLAIHTRFLTLEELLGYRFIKDEVDLVPAKWSKFETRGTPGTPETIPLSEVVAGVPDYYLDENGEKVPFEVNGSQFDEEYQRYLGRGDNWGFTAAMNDPAKWKIPTPSDKTSFPPPDGIYVLDDTTGEYKKHTTLRDFAYEEDIGEDGVEDWRYMIDLQMVIDDTLERTGGTENQYFSMGNTVTMVYPHRRVTNIGENDDFLAESLMQWWEGDRVESLTGNKADWALSSQRNDVLVENYEGEERLKEYFKTFGISWIPESVASFTTSTDGQGALAGFQRAKFRYDAPTTLVDDDPTGTYYYGLNDLYAIYAAYSDDFKISEVLAEDVIEALKDDLPALTEMLTVERRRKALGRMEFSNPNVTFRYLDDRFEDDSVLTDDHLNEDSVTPLHMPIKYITDRYVAGMAFGKTNTRGPSVYVKELDDGSLTHLTQRDVNPMSVTDDPIPSFKKLTNFLPGEFAVWNNAASLDYPGFDPEGYQTYVPMMTRNNGEVQNDGTLLKPKFIWESGTLIEGDNEETIDTIHEPPVDFAATMLEILADNPKEHRGRIGWHRAGPEPDVTESDDPEGLLRKHRDHYEFVVMGRKGFNPLQTVVAPLGENGMWQTYLAAFPPENNGVVDVTDLENYKHRLVPASEMPTFVIESSNNELDGAGILVVNGNLTVRGTFAYHGLLIVMGDLRVEAVSDFLTNGYGDYVDLEGNVLMKDPPPINRWYYYVDGDTTTKHYSERVQIWKGEVIVQGKLMVGHKTITDTGNADTPPGRVEVRGSRGALLDTVNLWTKVAPYEEFETVRYGWSTDAATSGGYTLWGGQ